MGNKDDVKTLEKKYGRNWLSILSNFGFVVVEFLDFTHIIAVLISVLYCPATESIVLDMVSLLHIDFINFSKVKVALG
jgi:hypothetical protein